MAERGLPVARPPLPELLFRDLDLLELRHELVLQHRQLLGIDEDRAAVERLLAPGRTLRREA
jgi:hypothetical protein